ncbi:hypothetical protein BO82DRAFT_351794 [Aspergillus uvarum CBS 121591]|uniref:Uncharacterized protein n=1 Tax=Aspergillus uvarum CBS 121591 TaxID=1448315 RepID=A0A319CH80_9EURO|nr:hypothetical protein BO82DRAFT_351794 [Aspergillus uvarum CBS 121591]PYH84584.1 hypothetical protein BO82DRAFT_351794 [Aspergillus uvarum CBS 121591]
MSMMDTRFPRQSDHNTALLASLWVDCLSAGDGTSSSDAIEKKKSWRVEPRTAWVSVQLWTVHFANRSQYRLRPAPATLTNRQQAYSCERSTEQGPESIAPTRGTNQAPEVSPVVKF